MKSFTQYVNQMDNLFEMDENPNDKDKMQHVDADPNCLNSAIKLAIKKGHKDRIVDWLKSLGDEEINRELDEAEKGLGDVSNSNNKEYDPTEDEVVPSSVDTASPGIEGNE